MILMVVAVSCGLGASYMTSRLLADRQQEIEKVSILVAKKTLNNGDIIKTPEDMFVEKFYPKGDEPRNAIAEADKLKGRTLKRSLRPGDFVTLEDLLDDKNGLLSHNLPQGHQAVGIRVNPESIAGGFASLPHSRVNIISTVRRGSDSDSYAKILLENVLVLAADTNTNVGPDGRAMPANVVTVALKPEDVLKVELAKNIGTISLVLRKFNDFSKAEKDTLTVRGMLSKDNSTGAEEVVSPEPGGATPPVASIPLPPINTPPKEAAPQSATTDHKDPTKFHTLVITEGDTQRKVEYPVDENGRPINIDVRRTTVVPTPPAPGAPAPAPAPAPNKDDAPPAPDGGF
jgi:pilus assembly protein CpaB